MWSVCAMELENLDVGCRKKVIFFFIMLGPVPFDIGVHTFHFVGV